MVGKIVVFREKHSDRYLDASTPEATGWSFLKILKERVKDGYWYYREYEAPALKLTAEQKDILALTDEQINVLPPSTRNELASKKDRIARSEQVYLRRKKLEDEWFNAVDRILELPDEEAIKLTGEDVPGKWGRGLLVVEVLYARNDYEYEGYSFQEIE